MIASGAIAKWAVGKPEIITPSGGSYVLTAQGGTYSLTGNSAEIKKSKRLVASGGAYSYAGQQVNITAGPSVVSNLVRYINVLTGEVMILKPF